MTMALTPDHDAIALRDFLAILANELRLFALSGKGIEDRVGEEIAAGAARVDNLLISLQGLDHLVQTANELSHFLDDVALQTDCHLQISVAGPARRVRLRALSEALSGHHRDTAAQLHNVGEVDLF